MTTWRWTFLINMSMVILNDHSKIQHRNRKLDVNADPGVCAVNRYKMDKSKEQNGHDLFNILFIKNIYLTIMLKRN